MSGWSAALISRRSRSLSASQHRRSPISRKSRRKHQSCRPPEPAETLTDDHSAELLHHLLGLDFGPEALASRRYTAVDSPLVTPRSWAAFGPHPLEPPSPVSPETPAKPLLST